MKSTAILIGATGLIGGHILEALKHDNTYDVIKVVVRRQFKDDHPKVKVEVIDFNDEDEFKAAMEGGNVVFSTIGTTQKKVKGDKDAYRKVDFDITVNAAKFSSFYGCKQFIVVSSVGADSSKGGFYLKLKGEVEDALIELAKAPQGIESLSIFRPSLLLGDRSETRMLEGIGRFLSKALSFLFPKKMKPVQAITVARAMVAASKLRKRGVKVYHYEDMRNLIERK